ncbi:MAG: hypothetical protein CO042_03270 [Parcubacteria group bacterium CG_4_9_14_0_2_um_filter_41_8]|nr:MAG: hypothetical protein COV79_05415 [Parcubacteria group bacterium CG11_big_fil_rev_8_21_14_0_20_41_14]PIZ81905.1 MAG: hypothetical protein COY02_00900 [Parcubacteria group bacterium CG_4_10_14_0_2_um_filter_41_6]PJC40533.1 MAG: hypothetical protein CO042_03270 [Parcubacteria group bacterium CG_4_9_14_0_2_um_filter_41_8]
MEKENDQIYCSHILQAIKEIESFVLGLSFENFKKDAKTQRAVTRNLEIIGEAAKRLSQQSTSKHPNIPWRNVAGMRDFLIHDYMDVDAKEIWKAAIDDIPELKKVISEISKNEN